jgi:hypothetical protein
VENDQTAGDSSALLPNFLGPDREEHAGAAQGCQYPGSNSYALQLADRMSLGCLNLVFGKSFS